MASPAKEQELLGEKMQIDREPHTRTNYTTRGQLIVQTLLVCHHQTSLSSLENHGSGVSNDHAQIIGCAVPPCLLLLLLGVWFGPTQEEPSYTSSMVQHLPVPSSQSTRRRASSYGVCACGMTRTYNSQIVVLKRTMTLVVLSSWYLRTPTPSCCGGLRPLNLHVKQ
eukprot:5894751-Amphidinium_carterae.4